MSCNCNNHFHEHVVFHDCNDINHIFDPKPPAFYGTWNHQYGHDCTNKISVSQPGIMSGLYRKDGPLTCNCECAHTTTMLTNVETTAKIVLTIEMIYTNIDFNHAVDIIPGNMYTIQYLEDGELKQCSGMVKDIYKVYALDEETGIYKIKIDCSVNYNNNVVVIKSDQIRDVRAYVKYADEDTTIDTSTHSYGTTVAALIKDAIVTNAELDANGNILKGVIVQGSLNGSKTVDGIAKGTNRSGHEIYVINGTSTNGSIASGYILNAIAISGDIDGDKDPTTGYVTNATVKGIISEAVIIDSIITDCKTEGGTVIEPELSNAIVIDGMVTGSDMVTTGGITAGDITTGGITTGGIVNGGTAYSIKDDDKTYVISGGITKPSGNNKLTTTGGVVTGGTIIGGTKVGNVIIGATVKGGVASGGRTTGSSTTTGGTFVPNAAISKDSPIVKEVLQNPDYDKVNTDIQGITVRKNYKDLLLMVNRDDSPGLYTNLSDRWLFKED